MKFRIEFNKSKLYNQRFKEEKSANLQYFHIFAANLHFLFELY